MIARPAPLVLAAVAGHIAAALPGFAQTWTLTSAPMTNWTALASSADGRTLVAAAGGIIQGSICCSPGPIYYSTNSGTTWMPASAPVTNWTSVTCSADGVKSVAVSYGPIYTSTNSGAAWTPTSAPITNWQGAASSADGRRLVAVAWTGLVCTSADSGATWAPSSVPANLNAVASSADGIKLALASGSYAFGGTYYRPIYVSTNAGATWSATSSPNGYWTSAASSVDGRIVAAAGLGSLYTSHDGGATWVAASLPPQIGAVASSADGSKLIALGPTIYNSADSGSTWTSNSGPVANWSLGSSSADGSALLAVDNVGDIWVCQAIPTPLLSMSLDANRLALSWTMPATDFTLQQNSDLTTTNWVDAPVTPILNLTSLRYEVGFSPTNANSYFRLKH